MYKHPTKPDIYGAYPFGVAAAIAAGTPRFTPLEPSPCGHEYASRYVEGGDCFVCETSRAAHRCAASDAPKSAAEAVERGADAYLVPQPCNNGPHLMRISVKTGKCIDCAHKHSRDPNRAAARRAGLKTYVPVDPCPKCKTRVGATVATRRCLGCHGGRADTSEMMRNNPDMILSRADAAKFNIPVYRTGKPCSRGHYAFRYVINRGCIACKMEIR